MERICVVRECVGGGCEGGCVWWSVVTKSKGIHGSRMGRRDGEGHGSSLCIPFCPQMSCPQTSACGFVTITASLAATQLLREVVEAPALL